MFISSLLVLFCCLITFTFGYSFLNIKTIANIFNINSLEKKYILLSPFVGLSIILFILQTFGAFKGVKFIAPIIFIVFILLFIRLLVNKKIKTELVYIFAENKIVFLAIVISTLINSIPNILAGEPTSFVGTHNNDLLFYLSIPERLKDYSYFLKDTYDVFKPFYNMSILHFSRFSRVGVDYFNSLLISIFNLSSVKTTNVISIFLCNLNVLVFFFVLKYNFRLKNILVNFTIILVSVSSIVSYTIAEQYLPQLAGNLCLLLSYGLIFDYLINKEKNSLDYSFFSTSLLISVYSEYLSYLCVPVTMYSLMLYLSKKNTLKETLGFLFKILFISIVLNPVAFYCAFKYNLFAITSISELSLNVNNRLTSLIFSLSGISTFLVYFKNILIFFILCIFILVGCIKLDEKIKIYFGFICGYFILMGLYFYFINKFDYGYYKNIISFSPYFTILLSTGIVSIYLAISNFVGNDFNLNKISYLIPAIFIYFNISNSIKIYSNDFNIVNYCLIDKKYYELSLIEHLVPKDEVLYIKEIKSNSEESPITFYLKNTNIYFETLKKLYVKDSIPEYDTIRPKNLNYVLERNPDIIKYDNEQLLWNNEIFRLYKYDNIENNVNLGSGWYSVEYWDRPTRWTEKMFEINLVNMNKAEFYFQFKASTQNIVEEKTLEIYINDTLQDVIKISSVMTEYKTKILNLDILNSDNCMIRFVLKEDSNVIGNDPRELGIAIQDIKLIN